MIKKIIELPEIIPTKMILGHKNTYFDQIITIGAVNTDTRLLLATHPDIPNAILVTVSFIPIGLLAAEDCEIAAFLLYLKSIDKLNVYALLSNGLIRDKEKDGKMRNYVKICLVVEK
jgi:hypothetical protein